MKREFSWAELSLKLPIVIQMKDSHTSCAEERHVRGEGGFHCGRVIERLQCESTPRNSCGAGRLWLWLHCFGYIYNQCPVRYRMEETTFSSLEIPSLCLSLHISDKRSGPRLRSPRKSKLESPGAKQTSQNTNLKQYFRSTTRNKILFAQKNVKISPHI